MSAPARSRRASPALLLALLALACGGGSSKPKVDPYLYAPPPAAAPDGLEADTWLAHERDDLLPYWTMPDAQGPAGQPGNFPTRRGMNGAVPAGASTDRYPRMLGRQVFTYCIGYMLTGDEALLDLARAGNAWLLAHAVDSSAGGWHALLDATGAPVAGAKLAQDMAYAAMGPGAFYFVTRDPASEAAVLATRDLLFDPAKLWDAAGGRIRDGMDPSLTAEAYMSPGGPGNWQLVAQLDPVTAFLLLDQPVLSDPARRDQALGDLRTLALRIRESFWRDGQFWGTTGGIGQYGGWHSDFGHILKAYWALLQIDKRLADRPLAEFLAVNAPATLRRAHDETYGAWAKQPSSATAVQYGSDWWAFAESDQLAATLALHDPSWLPVVARTSTFFRDHYVDRTRAAREVVPSVNRAGAWVYGWPDTDTAKCNEWKNGFHAAEHALVMYLVSHWAGGTPAPLYFAFPADRAQALAEASRPYTLDGRVASVELLGPLAGDPSRVKVKVSFDQLR